MAAPLVAERLVVKLRLAGGAIVGCRHYSTQPPPLAAAVCAVVAVRGWVAGSEPATGA